MDVTLTPEQEEICAAARKLLARRAGPGHVRGLAGDARGYDPSLWREMAELGWLGLAVPEQHGGLGAGFIDLCLLVEEQGRAIVPGPFLSTVVLGARAIASFGSVAQQAAHLPAVAGGERIIAVARTAPGGDWEPTAVAVTAARDRDGYLVDGAATLVDYAHVADLLLVVARLGDALSVFLVPAGTAGVAMRAEQSIGDDRPHEVTFTGVRLAEDAVLGRPRQGEPIARALAAWGAAARCAELVGIGQRVLEMTVDYAKERTAFGQPIGAFQAVQHHCADMAADILASRAITREAVWCVDAGDAAAGETVAVAKAWVSDAVARACALGHQVHGAIGFTAEHDLHLLARRARVAELDFGDGAWHRGQLADVIGLG